MSKEVKKISREMRVRKVPIDIHRSIVIQQKIMSKDKEAEVSLDEAAIEVWRLGILAIPHLNK